MWLDLAMIAVGLSVLVVGADGLVRGAASIAARFNISPLVIGLTVVSFGTSAPELAVNLISSLNDASGLAIGNIVGSNIANILLILGVAALIVPLTVQRSTVWKEIPFAFLGVFLLLVLGNDAYLDGGHNLLSRTDGVALLSIMGIFMFYIFSVAKNSDDEQDDIVIESVISSILWVGGGLLGLVIGGQLLVDGSVGVARQLGLSEAVIGLTILAIGTSLPELATTVVAAMRKQADIAIGNVVGSNIFNMFFVLGITASISPLTPPPYFSRDVLMAIAATILLFAFMFIGRKQQLRRWEGILFLLLYVAYMGLVVAQG